MYYSTTAIAPYRRKRVAFYGVLGAMIAKNLRDKHSPLYILISAFLKRTKSPSIYHLTNQAHDEVTRKFSPRSAKGYGALPAASAQYLFYGPEVIRQWSANSYCTYCQHHTSDSHSLAYRRGSSSPVNGQDAEASRDQAGIPNKFLGFKFDFHSKSCTEYYTAKQA